MTKLYVVFIANKNDVITYVFSAAYKTWTNAIIACDNLQEHINERDEWDDERRGTRRAGILTVDASLTNNRVRGKILNQFVGHNYNEYNL